MSSKPTIVSIREYPQADDANRVHLHLVANSLDAAILYAAAWRVAYAGREPTTTAPAPTIGGAGAGVWTVNGKRWASL